MSTKAEMGGPKPPFWGYYIGNPIVKNNRILRENGARMRKSFIMKLGSRFQKTYLLVTVATFTVETRHVIQVVHNCAMYPEGDKERRCMPK